MKWNAPSGVTGYTLRWRKMPDHVVQEPYRGITRTVRYDHSEVGWEPQAASASSPWQYPAQPVSTGVSQYTIPSLTSGEIYAVQLNYTTSGGEVFSARERYVWPSADFPSNGKRVATYPFFGHWPNREYVYSICTQTFPQSTRKDWATLIRHAFEQWETTGAVQMTPSSESCTVEIDKPLSMIGSIYNEANEVFMVPTDDSNLLAVASRNFALNILFQCVFNSRACVISTGYLQFTRQAKNELSGKSVDILINQSTDSWGKAVPGKNKLPSDDDVQFNVCSDPNDEGSDAYKAYSLMTHESGHALGISGFSFLGLLDPVAMAHPTIDDTVFEYNWGDTQCSPYPFDRMAIYALYQKILP